MNTPKNIIFNTLTHEIIMILLFLSQMYQHAIYGEFNTL